MPLVWRISSGSSGRGRVVPRVERRRRRQRVLVGGAVDHDLAAFARRRQQAAMARRRQGQARLDQIQAAGELARRQAPVLARGDGAEPRRRQQRFGVFQPVFRQHRHPVAAPDAARLQRRRQAPRAFVERGEGEAARARLERHALGEDRGLGAEQARDRAARGRGRRRARLGLRLEARRHWRYLAALAGPGTQGQRGPT